MLSTHARMLDLDAPLVAALRPKIQIGRKNIVKKLCLVLPFITVSCERISKKVA